ncbi:MAG: Tll0287-like domain-containing protein [Prosthecobacter sp.]
MRTSAFIVVGIAAFALLVTTTLTSCGGKTETAGISPQSMADALHAVMESDRIVYTRQVVNRLQNEEKIIKATEHWKDEKTLPLPAQMFRMGAEMVAEKKKGFSYALLSEWPINKQNAPKTEAEKAGLSHVAKNKGQNYYAEETLAGTRYFTAVYPDIAVAAACVKCHNGHEDSPRTDFVEGDVMGGVIIRIPLAAK